MRWIMREEFRVAYEKAGEVLDRMPDRKGEMIRTSDIIDVIQQMLNINVRYFDYDFSELSEEKSEMDFSKYGAAMCVSDDGEKRLAKILLNKNETAKMKRFSLVHELGHLITKSTVEVHGYQVSTHIDMDITTIPDSILDDKRYGFLLNEQIANIFALLVLIPYDMLRESLSKYDSLEQIANRFGVEKDALFSRLMLEDAKGILNAE